MTAGKRLGALVLVVATASAIGITGFVVQTARSARAERRAVAMIWDVGGTIVYDKELPEDGEWSYEMLKCKVFGVDSCRRILAVFIPYSKSSMTYEQKRAVMLAMADLPCLQQVILHVTFWPEDVIDEFHRLRPDCEVHLRTELGAMGRLF